MFLSAMNNNGSDNATDRLDIMDSMVRSDLSITVSNCRFGLNLHKRSERLISTDCHLCSRPGNGNDQNFQGGYLPKFVGQGGGYFGFSAQGGGGIYPPLEKPEVRLLASFRP